MTGQFPDLAIALSRRGISLNRQMTVGGWQEVSLVPLDDPELSAHVDAFRGEAQGAGSKVIVWIPRDQVQLVDVDASIKGHSAIHAAAMAAYPGAPSQSPDDFAFSIGEPDDTNSRPVAITPRAVLREAEEFVRKIGFDPVAYGLRTPLEDFGLGPRFTLASNKKFRPEYAGLLLLGCLVLGLALIVYNWQWRNSAYLGDEITVAEAFDTLPDQGGGSGFELTDWSSEGVRISTPEPLSDHSSISGAAFSPPEIAPQTPIFGLPTTWLDLVPLVTSDQSQFTISALAPVRIDDLTVATRRAQALSPFEAAIQADVHQLRAPVLAATTITLPGAAPGFAKPTLSPLKTQSNASLPIAPASFQLPPTPPPLELSSQTNTDNRPSGIAPLTAISRPPAARLSSATQAYPREMLDVDIALGTPQPALPYAGEAATPTRLPASFAEITRPSAAARVTAAAPNEVAIDGAAQQAADAPPEATEPLSDADAVILALDSLPVLRPVPSEAEALVAEAIAEAEAEALANTPSDIALSSQSAPLLRRAAVQGDVPPEVAEVADAPETQSSTLITLNHASPPFRRPAGFAERVAKLNTVEPDSNGPTLARPELGPQLPTSANVQEAATIENLLPMREMTLIGVYGTSGKRHALLRLSNGRIMRVVTGDKFSGGYVVAAIGSNAIRIRHNGRDTVLVIPE